MDSVIEKAAALAARAHEGQTDKSGAPYIGHPARVAARVEDYAGTEDLADARVVAWLHDVVEDTPMTLRELAGHFPAAVVAAVDAITKRAGEDKDDYYTRVRANRLALAVKYADIADNTDPVRTAALDAATRERLAAKYAHARTVLANA